MFLIPTDTLCVYCIGNRTDLREHVPYGYDTSVNQNHLIVMFY
jgi:hypothetical protein